MESPIESPKRERGNNKTKSESPKRERGNNKARQEGNLIRVTISVAHDSRATRQTIPARETGPILLPPGGHIKSSALCIAPTNSHVADGRLMNVLRAAIMTC